MFTLYLFRGRPRRCPRCGESGALRGVREDAYAEIQFMRSYECGACGAVFTPRAGRGRIAVGFLVGTVMIAGPPGAIVARAAESYMPAWRVLVSALTIACCVLGGLDVLHSTWVAWRRDARA